MLISRIGQNTLTAEDREGFAEARGGHNLVVFGRTWLTRRTVGFLHADSTSIAGNTNEYVVLIRSDQTKCSGRDSTGLVGFRMEARGDPPRSNRCLSEHS